MNWKLVFVIFVVLGALFNPTSAIPSMLFWLGVWALWRRHKLGNWQGVREELRRLPQAILVAIRPGPAQSSYVKTPAAGRLNFDVTPARAPAPFILYFNLLIFAGLFFLIPGKDREIFYIFGPLFGLVLLYTYYQTVHKIGKWRREASFSTSPEDLRVGDKTLARADIARLVLRNHIAASEVSSTQIVIGSGVAGVAAGMTAGAQAAAQQLGVAAAKAQAKRCWRLEAEAGGRAHVLAGGLDETTAYGLMSDVAKALQFS